MSVQHLPSQLHLRVYGIVLSHQLGARIGLQGMCCMLCSLYAKFVVDGFNSKLLPCNEFGSILKACKNQFSFFSCNSHFKFVRRNANKVAHSLARVTLLNTLIVLRVFLILL